MYKKLLAKNMRKQKILALSLVIALNLFAFYITLAWTEPSESPPGSNVPELLNASSDAQTKTGELTVANIKLNASGSGEGSVINADYIQGYNDLHLVSNDSSGSHDTAIYLGTSTYTKEIGFYIDDNEKMTLDSNGRLGIGITSPSRLLDVNGSIVIRGDKQSSPHGTSYTSNEEVIRIPGPTSDYIISVQDGSGRVQHYWNSTTLSATNKYLVSNEDAGMIDWSPPSDPYLEIKYASDGTAGNDISWTTHFAIKQNGNVGIGTTSPSYKLDVAGDVNGTQLCIAGDCKSSWPSGGGLWTDQGRYIYPNNYDKFVIMDKGIVGIGTNDPLANFDVQAEPGYNAFIRVGADAGKDPGMYFAEGTPGSEDNRWYIYGEGDSNDLYFDNPNYGDTKFVFTNEGNIGIGKTSPSYTLDVSGDIHSTGDICTDAGGGVCLSTAGGGGGFWTDQGTYIEPNTIGTNNLRIYDSGGLNIGGTIDPGENNLTVKKYIEGEYLKLGNWGGDVTASGGMQINNSNGDMVFSVSQATGQTAMQKIFVGGEADFHNNNVDDPIIRMARATVGEYRFYIDSDDKFLLSDYDNPRFVIDKDGNVGIGTSSPSYKLDISDNRAKDYVLRVSHDVTNSSPTNQAAIYGYANSHNEAMNAYGVLGEVSVSGSIPFATAIAGKASESYSSAWAGYFWGRVRIRKYDDWTKKVDIYDGNVDISGNLQVSGTKNAVVETSDGRRKMSAVEAPTVNFVTSGSSQTDNGKRVVYIENKFLETINPEAGYQVLITPTSDCSLYISQKNNDNFVVKVSRGEENCSFDWFLYGVRKGYEDWYMEKDQSLNK